MNDGNNNTVTSKDDDNGTAFTEAGLPPNPETPIGVFREVQEERQRLEQEHQRQKQEHQRQKQEYQRLDQEIQRLEQERQRLEQESQQKDQESQRLEQEHQRLDQEHQRLKQETQRLKQEVQSLEQEHQRLKQESQRLELEQESQRLDQEIFHNSYDDMVQQFDGIPDIMPRASNLRPHEHDGEAEILVDPSFVTDKDLQFEFSSKDKATGYSLQSMLHWVHLDENPRNKDGPKILFYENEAKVTDYIKYVVVMCLKSLGYFANARILKEMSLFSLRPDLVLVKHKTGGIILIIEVKMPGEVLFTSGGIAKRVADYLLLQYRLGNNMPFVLLSSYREACLCHLEPACLETQDASDVDGDSRDHCRGVVEEAAELLKSGKRLVDGMNDNKAEQEDTAEDHSPEKKSCRGPCEILPASPGPQQKRARLNSNDKPKVHKVSPKVVYSQAFDLRNMLHGVSLAIACGVVSLQRWTELTELSDWPEPMNRIDGLHPQVGRDTLQWVRVENMFIDYWKELFQSLDDFSECILVQEIGRGNFGRVFLAVDEYGAACALKFYLMDPQNFSHRQRKDARNEQLRKALMNAKEEVCRWQKLQGKYYDYAALMTLNCHAVVRMPVFFPVPPGERSNIINDVKNLLGDFWSKGYIFKEVRWQHVGRRPKNKNGEFDIALLGLESLLDLESLKKLDSTALAKVNLGPLLKFSADESVNSFIDGIDGELIIESQIDLLTKQINDKPQDPPQSLLNLV